MSDLDARLTAALQADAPPTRDAMFRLNVLVRLERARFRRRTARVLIAAAALAALAAVNAPAIDSWMAGDRERLWMAAIVASAALCVLPGLMLNPRLRMVAKALGRWLYP